MKTKDKENTSKAERGEKRHVTCTGTRIRITAYLMQKRCKPKTMRTRTHYLYTHEAQVSILSKPAFRSQGETSGVDRTQPPEDPERSGIAGSFESRPKT